MDNENKNIQENELTPEERVQEDISNKIADAAAEIQDEILEASGEEVEEIAEDFDAETEEDESWSDEAWEEALEEPEPVIIKKGHFILSLIAAALVGVIITVCCFQAPTWISNIPAGSTVASVKDTDVTDIDLEYFIFMEIAKYAQEIGIGPDGLSDVDWDEEIDGVKLADKIKKDAVDAAIEQAAIIEKGKENGIKLSDDDLLGIEAQVNGNLSQYGEEDFLLQLNSSGIKDVKEFKKLLKENTLYHLVLDDIKENSDNYYPEDKNELIDYVDESTISAKHILIKVEDEATDEEKRNQAQSILDRINAGEDFDALMAEFNEDTGEPAEGYTFPEGEMVAEFYEAALALEVGQVSELVKSQFGYHIIKRTETNITAEDVGEEELYAYIKDQYESKTKINEKKLAKISVEEIAKSVIAANDALAEKQNAASSK